MLGAVLGWWGIFLDVRRDVVSVHKKGFPNFSSFRRLGEGLSSLKAWRAPGGLYLHWKSYSRDLPSDLGLSPRIQITRASHQCLRFSTT